MNEKARPGVEELLGVSDRNIQLKKRNYFIGLGGRVLDGFRLHKDHGLWNSIDGKSEWGNVSEHCLVQVARTDVMAEILGLSDKMKKDLITGAALHDFYKKGEKEVVNANGLSWESFDLASLQSAKIMREAGFSDRVIRLANSAGHRSLLETETLLQKSDLSEEDTAFFVMHYADDCTLANNWAIPVEEINGRVINELDRRVDRNEAIERYQILNKEGRAFFNGETTFQAQRRIGHQVETRLAELMSEKSGVFIDPKRLPEVVDDQIRSKIMLV